MSFHVIVTALLPEALVGRGEMKNSNQKPAKKSDAQSSEEKSGRLSKELEQTFPASDAPVSTQPGSGTTGPEVATKKG